MSPGRRRSRANRQAGHVARQARPSLAFPFPFEHLSLWKSLPLLSGPAEESHQRSHVMQGDPKVIEYLNAQLKNELTAINQYFLHARMLSHWRLGGLGKHEYDESIDEMKHADALIERIFVLDGMPNLQDLGKLLIGEDAKEILECDLQLERLSQATLKEAISYCESVRDYVSREILEELLDATEDHIDWIETHLELIGKVGMENFLQSAMTEMDE
jgi:bacterioferritin